MRDEEWEEDAGSRNEGLYFDFGKYRGLSIEEVPDSYLQWIVDNFEEDRPRDATWIAAARTELDARDDSGYHIYD